MRKKTLSNALFPCLETNVSDVSTLTEKSQILRCLYANISCPSCVITGELNSILEEEFPINVIYKLKFMGFKVIKYFLSLTFIIKLILK